MTKNEVSIGSLLDMLRSSLGLKHKLKRWTTLGYATHVPLGDKTFSPKKTQETL